MRVIAVVSSMLIACGGNSAGSPDAAPQDAFTTPDAAPKDTAPPTAVLAISPLTHDFGAVNVVNHGSFTFTVTNEGQAASGELAAQLTGADADTFTVASTTCTTLAAAATCSIVVDFTPQSNLGAKTAVLSVVGTPGGSVTASLSGEVISFPSLQISPNVVSFAPTAVGAVSAPGTITVTNTSDFVTGTFATQLGGPDPSQFTVLSDACNGTVLQSMSSCAITLAFSPTIDAPSGDSASVDVSAPFGGTATASVTGTVIPTVALSITPSPHDFGSVAIGCPSAGSTPFVVTNTGGEISGILAITITGADAANFAIVSDACTGTSLSAAESCTISVRFAPQVPGAKAASLVATALGGTANATLLGNGLEDGAALIIVVASPFPDTIVGQRSAGQTLTLTNVGCAPTGLLFTALGGAHPTQFTIASDQCRGVALPANGQCTVTLAFAPTTATPSAKSADFAVGATPGGVVTVGLAGNGLAAAAPVLAIAPPSFDFGDVAAGTTAQTTLTVTNTGTASSGVLSTTSSGASDFTRLADGCSGVALAPNDGCTVTVELAPISAGAKSAAFTIASSATSVTAAVTGNAIADGAFLAITGSEQFADTTVGQSSATKAITVSNIGAVATGVLVDRLDPADFTIIADSCGGFVIDAGDDCTVIVAFTPATTGAHSASLALAGSPGGIASTGLSGTALAPPRRR